MKKKILICFLILWGLWIVSYFFIRIEINKDHKIWIRLNEPYEEFGASASFFGKELKIETTDNVNTKKSGTYYVCYKARNILGIEK